MKCNTCRNLCKRIDDDGTLYDWCGMIVDCPDRYIPRQCKYYQAATNADRIRAMSDEELAELLVSTDGDFPPNCENVPVRKLEAYWLDWLKQEAE